MRAGLEADEAVELLRDILIVQLGRAGVPRRAIREIVRCDINRITRILRHVSRATSEEEE